MVAENRDLAAAITRLAEHLVFDRFPKIRNEAQLYAIGPLLSSLHEPGLRRVFARLMAIPDFRDAYEEITERSELPPE